jgi:hypothetical protein
MPNEIQQKLDAVAAITITPASLANNAIRSSLAIANASQRQGALLQVRLTVGTTPTAGGSINIYLLRGNGSGYRTDGWAGTDAVLVPPGGEMNAKLLDTIFIPVATSDVQYFKDIDTLIAGAGYLGVEWGIAIENKTGAALDATGGNHVVQQVLNLPEIQ